MGMGDFRHNADEIERFGRAPEMLNRCAIVVLGMHRSGTSALTRMLALMGCALPATLVPANKTNPAGHWESQPICDFDDAAFAAAGTHWLDWLPINPEFPRSVVWPGLVERARSLLQSEFGAAPLFAIKDPRMCRLADLWLEALDAEGVQAAIVLVLRHPQEISSSLAAGGYPIDEGFGQLLWLRHLLSAEAATRNRRRTFVTFDMLMSDWETVADKLTADLEVHWPHRTQGAAEEVDEFLTPKLRHHSASEQGPVSNRLRSWVAEVYAILSRWTEEGENPEDYPALDALLQAFDAAGPIFARPLIASAEARQEVEGLKRELAAALRGHKEVTAERDLALVAKETALIKLDAAHTLLNERIAAERDRLNSENDAHQEAEKLRHDLAFAQSRCLQREEQLAQIETQGVAEREERDGLRDAISRSQSEITRLTNRLAEADQWVLQLASERKAAEQAARRVEASSAHKVKLATAEVAKIRGEFHHALSVAEARITAARKDHEIALIEAAEQMRLSADERIAAAAEDLTAARTNWDAQMRDRYKEITILTGLLRAREEEANTLAASVERIQTGADARIAVAERELVESRNHWDTQMRERQSEITNLENELTALRAHWDAQMHELHNDITSLESRLQESQHELLESRAYWDAQNRERDSLERQILELQNEAAAQAEAANWSGRIATALNAFPKWWAFVPRSVRERWEEERLSGEGIFNADSYRAANPDVAAAGVSPVRHYLRFGLQERRKGIR